MLAMAAASGLDRPALGCRLGDQICAARQCNGNCRADSRCRVVVGLVAEPHDDLNSSRGLKQVALLIGY